MGTLCTRPTYTRNYRRLPHITRQARSKRRARCGLIGARCAWQRCRGNTCKGEGVYCGTTLHINVTLFDTLTPLALHPPHVLMRGSCVHRASRNDLHKPSDDQCVLSGRPKVGAFVPRPIPSASTVGAPIHPPGGPSAGQIRMILLPGGASSASICRRRGSPSSTPPA